MGDGQAPRPRHGAAPSSRPSAASARRSRPAQAQDVPRRQPRFKEPAAASGATGAPPSSTSATAPVRPVPASGVPSSPARLDSALPKSHAQAPQSRLSRGAAIAISLGAVALLAGVLVFVLTRCVFVDGEVGAPSVAPGQTVVVAIPEGAGGDVIAAELLKAGVIDDERAFMQAVNSQGADQKLKPGTYQLLTGMDPKNVVAQLVAGPNTQEGRLTVPEGLTVAQTADVVAQALGIPAEEFLAKAKASDYVADYPFLAEVADDSLEGYLWAKTYDFAGKEISADGVIRAMLDQYAAEVAPLDFASGERDIAAAYGFDATDYDILKMASIIQREGGSDEDRGLVSSVLWNRIREGMALQSDATMGYVTGGEVSADDLQTESPYNTYLHEGLPPTPICTPDLACIEAALHPESSDYLYFLLIERDGYSKRTFSRTYEEHLQAIDEARREMAERGL